MFWALLNQIGLLDITVAPFPGQPCSGDIVLDALVCLCVVFFGVMLWGGPFLPTVTVRQVIIH